jgi:ClpP class serine protease
MYDFFIDRVAEGRKMDPDRVREVAGGRVYFGTQAKELGLVDRLGGLRDAVEFAAEATGIKDDYRTVYFRAFPGFHFYMLMDESVSGFGGRLLRELQRDDRDGLFETITIF